MTEREWYQCSFEVIVDQHLKLQISNEYIKQLGDRFEGEYGALYRLGSIAMGPAHLHNTMVKMFLADPTIPAPKVIDFAVRCDQAKFTGQRFNDQFAAYLAAGKDCSKLDWTPLNVVDYDTIVATKITELQDQLSKIPNTDKASNWLFGQIIKTLDRATTDMVALRQAIDKAMR